MSLQLLLVKQKAYADIYKVLSVECNKIYRILCLEGLSSGFVEGVDIYIGWLIELLRIRGDCYPVFSVQPCTEVDQLTTL